jgi:hypothetical protein
MGSIGTYTYRGRSMVRGADMVDATKHSFWLALGRCDLSWYSVSMARFPWANENQPPVEDPVNAKTQTRLPDEKSTEMGAQAVNIGVKKASIVSLCIPDPVSGTIAYGPTRWKLTGSPTTSSPWLYLRFEIEEDDFTYDLDSHFDLDAYRRPTIITDMYLQQENARFKMKTTARYDDFYDPNYPNSRVGTVFYTSNEIKQTREPGETHIVEIILPM